MDTSFPDTVITRGNPLPADFDELGIKVDHFFVGNGYTKLFTIPAGRVIGQHKHTRGHYSVLLVGKAVLHRDDNPPMELDAPSRVWVHAGIAHSVVAKTDALWACIWDNPTAESDPVAFDREVTRS